ncbi:MAG: hypothetical protein COT15_05155 [Candidatus Diapherotrites archaeon CG08_land_8_20_14_0_20_34_12]|nr:MAG: hypothetical protein COT15_05155 [Candidatus Diapherotrites archaeon CG08_land_8_20_14_0_20_34_12]
MHLFFLFFRKEKKEPSKILANFTGPIKFFWNFIWKCSISKERKEKLTISVFYFGIGLKLFFFYKKEKDWHE